MSIVGDGREPGALCALAHLQGGRRIPEKGRRILPAFRVHKTFRSYSKNVKHFFLRYGILCLSVAMTPTPPLSFQNADPQPGSRWVGARTKISPFPSGNGFLSAWGRSSALPALPSPALICQTPLYDCGMIARCHTGVFFPMTQFLSCRKVLPVNMGI